MALSALDPEYEARVRASFAKQKFMKTLGAELTRVEPGEVELVLPTRPDLTQQHGYVHAGAVTSVVDSACGFAALSLMPPRAAVLSVEFKMNLLAPAVGERLVAVGRVKKAGRTLMVCTGDVFAESEEGLKEVATMTATMMVVRNRGIED
jgi:uncharacterized protein (TIGR00369 family)